MEYLVYYLFVYAKYSVSPVIVLVVEIKKELYWLTLLFAQCLEVSLYTVYKERFTLPLFLNMGNKYGVRIK